MLSKYSTLFIKSRNVRARTLKFKHIHTMFILKLQVTIYLVQYYPLKCIELKVQINKTESKEPHNKT